MKTIKIMQGGYNIKTLYEEANSKATRALLGYMLKTGRTDDLTFGGAFHSLKEIESCKGELYRMKLIASNYKEIVAIIEVARAGGFDKFAISAREVKTISRRIADLI